jgi:hypothetical protein
VVVARKRLSDARKEYDTRRDTAQTAAQKLISKAHEHTYKNRASLESRLSISYERIKKA